MTLNSYSSVQTLVLLLVEQHLAAWQILSQGAVHAVPIEGESEWLPIGESPSRVAQSISDLDERLGRSAPLWLIYDSNSQEMLESAIPQLVMHLKGRNWQILSYDIQQARFGAGEHETGLPPRDWIAQEWLPILFAVDDFSERERIREATRLQHDQLSEQMLEKRQQLERENERLKRQALALRTVDAERLLTFLPALFPRVFSVINGRDLALLTGRIEPYDLQNPYPEPSEETLFTLQRRFKALTREHQLQIIALMAELPQRQHLKPRPEMREWVLLLESEVLNGKG
ncbi:hypothetical protein PCI56_08225 [Plesiomonas shigelloides subsp. oncorhynchi]|uniref:hypothetical protein n=1 Tax=Plesiomonas shigelloides TaxID=703 RepID=UPI0012620EE7|nr:hypothetical protein [Plesiomonas shigelloides]KAB7676159.1 hypothetical protein GBN16_08655 [Plesiomonas shigelloides]MDA1379840.1 hypothetical protein [Plesiomonas shigelloides]